MKKKLVIIFISILMVAIVTTIVLARYIDKYQKNSLYEAEQFYFRSDLLKEESKTYKYPGGTNRISINLYNNVDKLRYTKMPIKFSVVLNKIENGGTFKKIREINDVLQGNKIIDKEILFDNLESGNYNIKAISSEPYVKTLEAIFIIENKDNNIVYEINDSSDSTVVFLTVKTLDYEGNVKIKFPEGVYPDNTEDMFKDLDIEVKKEVIVRFNHYSSYTYRFYKNNPKQIFTKDDFAVGGV